MEPQAEEEVLQLRIVNSKGAVKDPVTISKTTPGRSSGFPQIEKLENRLMLAWTVISADQKEIRVATYDFK